MNNETIGSAAKIQPDGAGAASSAPAEQAVITAVSSPEPEARPTVPESADRAQQQKEKKPAKAGKVILVILIVLLSLIILLSGAAFLTYRAMLRDNIPQAPGTADASGTDIETLVTSSAKEILYDKTMTVDVSPINALLDMLKQTVNDSADSVRVEDLFCEFGDSQGMAYSRVYVDTVSVNGRDVKLGRTVPVSLSFDVDFEDPCIVLIPVKLRCGTVDVPEFILHKILENASSATSTADGGGGDMALENNTARIYDGKIYIDIGDFCGYAAQVTGNEINEMLSDEKEFEEYRTTAGDEGIFGYIKDTADVQISGIDIENGKLVIHADVSMLFNRTHDCPGKDVIAGDYFFFGSYPQSTKQPEPIKWLVLDVRDGKALAISETLLDCKLYSDKYVKVTWSDCSLRKWLNGDFYNSAFSDGEKNMIRTVTNANPDNNVTGAKGGPDTEDKVFCLALDEAKGYEDKIDLRAAVTDYAVSQGADTSSQSSLDGRETGYWWLRSPGMDNMSAAYVYPNGICSSSGTHFISVSDVCVRPVIEVSLSE